MKSSIALVLHSAARPLVARRLADPLGVRAVMTFLAALLALFMVWSGWLYPLRPDVIGGLLPPFDPLFPGTWGRADAGRRVGGRTPVAIFQMPPSEGLRAEWLFPVAAGRAAAIR